MLTQHLMARILTNVACIATGIIGTYLHPVCHHLLKGCCMDVDSIANAGWHVRLAEQNGATSALPATVQYDERSWLLMQASMSDSLGRMVLGTCALWLPCLPLFWFMRKALNNRTNTK